MARWIKTSDRQPLVGGSYITGDYIEDGVLPRRFARVDNRYMIILITGPTWRELEEDIHGRTIDRDISPPEYWLEGVPSHPEIQKSHKFTLGETPVELTNAEVSVIMHRRHQVHHEGFTAEMDDRYEQAELSRAAAAYAIASTASDETIAKIVKEPQDQLNIKLTWPRGWAWKWFKPVNRRTSLMKSAACAIAEMERIERMKK